MNTLEVFNGPMKNHEQAGIIEHRTTMRENIEREPPCAITG